MIRQISALEAFLPITVTGEAWRAGRDAFTRFSPGNTAAMHDHIYVQAAADYCMVHRFTGLPVDTDVVCAMLAWPALECPQSEAPQRLQGIVEGFMPTIATLDYLKPLSSHFENPALPPAVRDLLLYIGTTEVRHTGAAIPPLHQKILDSYIIGEDLQTERVWDRIQKQLWTGNGRNQPNPDKKGPPVH